MRLRHLLEAVAEFCYPSRCAKCDTGFEGTGPLCPACSGDLQQLEAQPACRLCAMPLAHHDGDCPYCLGKGAPHYEKIQRLAIYREPLKETIHQMKYAGRWSLAEELADRLCQQRHVRQHLAEVDVIVPVPLHWRRQLSRGYNQSEVLARRVGRQMHIGLARPVVRIRDTPTQTQLSREQRQQNLKGALALVDGKHVEGRRVLVVDDVMTTGATLQSIARVLQEARPASLSALVIAVGDPRGRDFEAI
jgi:ComF family protein